MTEAQFQHVLRRIFDVIACEAERNPALARKLADAMGKVVAQQHAPARPPRPPFDASRIHAINILRQHGEAALRGRLEQVKAVQDLKSVARASGLVLSGAAAKPRPSRADLIEAIVAAARHYDAQRSAATA